MLNKELHSNIKFAIVPILLIALTVYPTFFGQEFVPIIIIALVFAAIFEPNKKSNLKLRLKLLFPYFFAIFVYLSYTVLSPDFGIASKILERQVSLIVVPFIIILCTWSNKRISMFCEGFVLTMLFVSVSSVFMFISFIVENSEWVELMAESGTSKLLYLQYKYPHILNTHPTYWSYLILAAIFLLNSFLLDKKKTRKGWGILAYIVLGMNLFYLAGRTPILIYTITQLFFLISIIRSAKNKNQKTKRYFLVFSGLIFVFCLLINAPLFMKKTEIFLEDERLHYWPLALNKIQENYFLLGEGLGQSNEIIRKHIIEYGDNRIRYKAYDLHNQYLRHFVDMGMLGFISLVWLVGYSAKFLRRSSKENQFATFSFLILFFLAMMTESYLIRLKGILFFAVFSSLLLVLNHQDKTYNNQ